VKPVGYLSLVLHAHLPFVRHPEHPEFFEERWLFEAITECYVPLIRAFNALLRDGVKFRVAVSLSPTLIEMLQDELLQERYLRHMEKLVELSEKEVARTRNDPPFYRLACMHRQWFRETIDIFDRGYKRNLVRAFSRIQEQGVLELLTTAATHGFLPLLKEHPASVRAQLWTAADVYRRNFGREPRGIWLPECAYYPGVEELLQEAGFTYFMVDSHGLLHADVRPHYGLFAPVACENGVAAFGRDPDCSRQVWSSTEGYPGDFDYREFYRDVGFDLPLDYVAPYILDQKTRCFTGVKYHRVTGKGEYKEYYEPDKARNKAALHAGDFLARRRHQIAGQAVLMDRPPLVLAPYDAELFGHWWFEGPQFLDFFIRKAHFDQHDIELITPGDYLARHPVLQRATPSASSWGWQGYNDCWLSGPNEWIYPHLHDAARAMTDLARTHREEPAGTLRDRALRQAARSLLLAQSSDWPFIMKCGTSVQYAERRVRDHLARFHYLCDAVRRQQIDQPRLVALEQLDKVFPHVDYRWFVAKS
jgi:1,4-alpha-glucan branching enzyme